MSDTSGGRPRRRSSDKFNVADALGHMKDVLLIGGLVWAAAAVYTRFERVEQEVRAIQRNEEGMATAEMVRDARLETGDVNARLRRWIERVEAHDLRSESERDELLSLIHELDVRIARLEATP